MIKYFYGPDTFAARKAVERVSHEQNATIRWLDKSELAEQSLTNWLERTSSGLFGMELPVVRDPSSYPKSLQEAIVEDVKEKQGSGQLILWDRVLPDKRSVLFKALKPYAEEFPVFDRNTLTSWLIAEVSERGGSFEKQAAGMLIDRVGTDKWQLLSEVEKLLLRYDVITPTDIEQNVPVAEASEEIFALLDALGSGNARRAITVMQTLLQTGDSEFYILSMLAYQFRTLLHIRQGLDKHMSADAIAKQWKLHPYVVQKNTPVARKWTESVLLDLLTRVMATDFSIKQGKVDARTAVTMLMVSLTQQRVSA